MKNKESGVGLNWNFVILSVTVFAILTILVMYMPNIKVFDENVIHSIQSFLSPYPSYIPVFISGFGMTNNMLWPQITAASVLVSHRLYAKAGLLVLFVWLTYFVKNIVKNYVCRERPLNICEEFSFPSGHTALSMCFYGILIYLVHKYVGNNFWRNFLIILFGVWIVLVAVSRMWLGAHFLTDVLAGAFLGFMMVNLYIIICKALNK